MLATIVTGFIAIALIAVVVYADDKTGQNKIHPMTPETPESIRNAERRAARIVLRQITLEKLKGLTDTREISKLICNTHHSDGSRVLSHYDLSPEQLRKCEAVAKRKRTMAEGKRWIA